MRDCGSALVHCLFLRHLAGSLFLLNRLSIPTMPAIQTHTHTHTHTYTRIHTHHTSSLRSPLTSPSSFSPPPPPPPSRPSDQLRRHYTAGQYHIEVDIDHVRQYKNVLAEKLKNRPSDTLPLVRCADGKKKKCLTSGTKEPATGHAHSLPALALPVLWRGSSPALSWLGRSLSLPLTTSAGGGGARGRQADSAHGPDGRGPGADNPGHSSDADLQRGAAVTPRAWRTSSWPRSPVSPAPSPRTARR